MKKYDLFDLSVEIHGIAMQLFSLSCNFTDPENVCYLSNEVVSNVLLTTMTHLDRIADNLDEIGMGEASEEPAPGEQVGA